MKHKSILRRRGALMLLAVAAVVITASQPVEAEEHRPRVSVLPLAISGDDSRLSTIALTVHGSLTTVLRILGNYELIPAPADYTAGGEPADSGSARSGAAGGPAVDTERFAALAEELSVENLLFGSVRENAGELELALSVYNRVAEAVTVSERATAPSLFDVFSATDDLLSAVLEGFTGARLAFGSIRLRPTGEPRRYTVLVDGKEFGRDLTSIEPVPTGNHHIAVTQTRLGGEVSLYAEEVTVEEGRQTEVAFAVPFLTPEERALLLSDEREALHAFAADRPWAPYLTGGAGNEIAEGLADWNPNYARLQTGRAALRELLDSQADVAAQSTAAGDQEMPSESLLRGIGYVGARILALKEAGSGEAWPLPRAEITVDGDPAEWRAQGVLPNIESQSAAPGRRVVDWAVARDDEYLYLRARYSESPEEDGENRYRFMLFQTQRGRNEGDIEFGFNFRHDDKKNTDLYVARDGEWDDGSISGYGVYADIEGTEVEIRISLNRLPEAKTLWIRAYIHDEDRSPDHRQYQLHTLQSMVAARPGSESASAENGP